MLFANIPSPFGMRATKTRRRYWHKTAYACKAAPRGFSVALQRNVEGYAIDIDRGARGRQHSFARAFAIGIDRSPAAQNNK
jgi:hypothetical protein